MGVSKCGALGLIVVAVAATAACTSTEEPFGAVLIVIDTLRADRTSLYGCERQTTPHLEAWAQEAVVFERAYAPSPWTLPTVASMLTGRLPVRHRAGAWTRPDGELYWQRLDPSLPTVSERLRSAGYATAAIVNNNFLHRNFGLARGFDSYRYRPARNAKSLRADDVVDLALSWLDRHGDGPFFLLLHFFDPHMSYDPPAPFRGAFSGPWADRWTYPVQGFDEIRQRAGSVSAGELAFITAAYDEEIAYVDRQLGRFFEALRARRGWERLLVILTSDHGEELFDHGSFEHGHSLYQELLHVPLVVWTSLSAPRRVAEPVSLMDLAPTLTDALKAEPLGGTEGVSLWPFLVGKQQLESRSLVADGALEGRDESAIIRWPWKLIRHRGEESVRLYHLGDDPGELHDLSATHPRYAARLLGELESIREDADRSQSLDEPGSESERLGELRSLSYVR